MKDAVNQDAIAPETDAEANAALSAGYNKINPPIETPAEKNELEKVADESPSNTDAAQTAEKETAPDPWDSVPPVVRQTLDDITGRLKTLDALSKDVKTATGRVAAIQSELATAKAAAKSVAAAPTAEQIEGAAKSAQKWDDLRADFPEWTEAMDARFAAERTELLKHLPKADPIDVDGIKREVGASVTDAITTARQMARVDAKYEDWEDTIQTPEFAAWMQAQAPDIQALAYSEKARDAIQMLDLYHDHLKAAQRKDKNQARLAAAVTPKQATGGGPTILPDEAGLSVGYQRVRRA